MVGGDTLMLLDPFEDGNMDVTLCVDNGGARLEFICVKNSRR